MKHFTTYHDIHTTQLSAVAIGNFDGVHRGHQTLLGQVKKLARDEGLTPSVLTFEPHPVSVLAPHVRVSRLTSRDERLSLLSFYEIGLVLEQHFNHDFAQLSPRAFVENVLVTGLKARHVVVGYDFGFGAKRAGTVEQLVCLGAQLGFETHIVNAQLDDTEQVFSSSRIRACVSQGDMGLATELLGRAFHVAGRVERGDQRGRTLGFPTANVALDDDAMVRPGVYSGWLDFGSGPTQAVINLGRQPTFGAERQSALEVHALGIKTPDLYGKRVRVWFCRRLRDEQRFAHVDALKSQLDLDVKNAREQLDQSTAPPDLPWLSV